MGPMDQEAAMDRLKRAVAAHRRAQRRERTTHAELVGAMKGARDSGVRQVAITKETGYTREHVRRLLASDHDGTRSTSPGS